MKDLEGALEIQENSFKVLKINSYCYLHFHSKSIVAPFGRKQLTFNKVGGRNKTEFPKQILS